MSETTIVIQDQIEILEVGTQGPPGPLPSELSVLDIQYDGLDRVTSFVRGGVTYAVTYPNATTVLIVGGGMTKTITLDGNGRPASIVVS